MWKCKLCGAMVAPTSTAVTTHYEKQHFSVFIKNGSDIRRLPKAFLREVTQGKAETQKTPDVEKEITPKKYGADPTRNRQQNLNWLVEKIRDIDRDHTFECQEKKEFECPCCKRIVVNGKRLKHSREDYVDICYDCFKAARKIIAAMPKK